MKDYEFIKKFTNIKIKTICEKLKINYGNVSSGKTSLENYKRIKYELLNELLNLFIEDNEDMITINLYKKFIEKLERENKMLKEMI